MKYNKSGVFVRNNIIYVQGHVDGVFYRKSTKKEATKTNLLWAKKNVESVLLSLIGKNDEPKSYTVEEFGYLSLDINSSNRRENTQKGYLRNFRVHILPVFGKWDVTQIRPTDLKKWQNDLSKKISGKTVKNVRTVFRSILQDAFMDEILATNPFDRVKPPKVLPTEVNPCSLEEVQLITKNSNGHFRNYLLTAFFTGMRVGELIALHWEDIDFINDTISVKRSMVRGILDLPKTANSYRTIDMLLVVKETLLEQAKLTRGRSEFVFLNQYGENYKDSSNLTRRLWKPLLQRLDIEYRILYQTRHTFASLMLQQGEEIGWVSQMMGHRDIHTTLTKYARYIPRKQTKRAKFLNNIDFEMEQSAQNLHSVKSYVVNECN
ncbi:site-specific integrase [Sulfurimonas sp. HSL-1716]|uniref:site-specific integrase n=1 Tax=Hydrocurvibacter sulfurireducens TaxID=3131937 RepID=UPI0031F88B58